MKNILHTEPGAVSILCLCFETAKDVRVLIHRKILEKETIGCHPCINTASLKLSVRDLTEKFLEPAPVQPPALCLLNTAEDPVRLSQVCTFPDFSFPGKSGILSVKKCQEVNKWNWKH